MRLVTWPAQHAVTGVIPDETVRGKGIGQRSRKTERSRAGSHGVADLLPHKRGGGSGSQEKEEGNYVAGAEGNGRKHTSLELLSNTNNSQKATRSRSRQAARKEWEKGKWGQTPSKKL